MHALGFHHEQSRPDRDSYVEIRTTNIEDDQLHNFECEKDSTVYTPYDAKSIMHYQAWDFSKNYGPSIVSKVK